MLAGSPSFLFYPVVDDGDSQLQEQKSNEKKELEGILRKKEEMLRKLKLVKMYRAKVINNIDHIGRSS
jgi:hypothetical protein